MLHTYTMPFFEVVLQVAMEIYCVRSRFEADARTTHPVVSSSPSGPTGMFSPSLLFRGFDASFPYECWAADIVQALTFTIIIIVIVMQPYMQKSSQSRAAANLFEKYPRQVVSSWRLQQQQTQHLCRASSNYSCSWYIEVKAKFQLCESALSQVL